MNTDSGKITILKPGTKPNANQILLAKLPDPNCRFGCGGKGHNGVNPRTGKYHPCACTLRGYKDVKVKK
jgi:hypothetical protein